MSAHENTNDAHGHGHADDGEVHAHISSLKLYVGVFAALIFFTLLTVGVSYIHLGRLNLAVAILIASTSSFLLPTLKTIAKSSAKERTDGPYLINFSLGFSSSGRSLTFKT